MGWSSACQSAKMTVLEGSRDVVVGRLCDKSLNSNSDHRRCCASLEWLVLFVVRSERRLSMSGPIRRMAPNPPNDAETSWRRNESRGPRYSFHLDADAEDFSRMSSPCARRWRPACHAPVGLPTSRLQNGCKKTLVILEPRKTFCEKMDAENR